MREGKRTGLFSVVVCTQYAQLCVQFGRSIQGCPCFPNQTREACDYKAPIPPTPPRGHSPLRPGDSAAKITNINVWDCSSHIICLTIQGLIERDISAVNTGQSSNLTQLHPPAPDNFIQSTNEDVFMTWPIDRFYFIQLLLCV